MTQEEIIEAVFPDGPADYVARVDEQRFYDPGPFAFNLLRFLSFLLGCGLMAAIALCLAGGEEHALYPIVAVFAIFGACVARVLRYDFRHIEPQRKSRKQAFDAAVALWTPSVIEAFVQSPDLRTKLEAIIRNSFPIWSDAEYAFVTVGYGKPSLARLAAASLMWPWIERRGRAFDVLAGDPTGAPLLLPA